jgi:hypothetical protein
MIEGVIFSIDGDFPSEVAKCSQLYEGEASTPPTIDGPLLKKQLKGMEVRFVQRDWPSFESLPSEARALVHSFIDFVTRVVAGLRSKDISILLYSRFPNTGDASYVDIEELE